MTTDSPRLLALKLHAARLLVQADTVNVRRERTRVTANRQDATAHTDRLRALLASPEGRAALTKLTDAPQPAAGSRLDNPSATTPL